MPRTPRLPLHTLPAFRVVAQLQNLREAALSLHLTHSAVSQQIKLLEEQIGFALFDRRGRRIVLNPAGSELLRAVEPALAQLDDGVRAAASASCDAEQRIRLTLLPSFAQRWLLPRMGRWRERHPRIGIELHTSQQVVDLQRDGFHAALRQGAGDWAPLLCERLTDSPMLPVGSPEAARRLLGRPAAALADEPLLGSPELWQTWFQAAGVRTRVNPVAAFNDAGLMLQAAEQNLGIALGRELLVADALADGRLVRLSSLSVSDETRYAYWLVYPPKLASWGPLSALRDWLHDELAQSRRLLQGHEPTPPIRGGVQAAAAAQAPGAKGRGARETAPAGRSGSRSRARKA